MSAIYGWIDRLWRRISSSVFIRFEFDIDADTVRQMQQHGPVFFALAHGGVTEWLILSSWCRSRGLGSIEVANRRRVLLLSRIAFYFQFLFGRRRLSDLFLLDDVAGPRLLFVTGNERKKLFTPTQSEQLLCEVYTKLSERGPEAMAATHVTVVPIYILWRKHVRGGGRNLSEFLFGLSSNPNLIGKVWYLARRRLDSSVRALGTLPLVTRETTDSEFNDETEPMRIARHLRRRILVLIHQEMRVVLGPRYHSPYIVKETLLRDPEIQKVITEVAAEEGLDRRKIMSRAYGYLSEIVANYRFRLIEVSYVVLDWLLNKVFDGLETRDTDWQRLREVMKHKPVVFVACHRSHLDYLIVPYLMFNNNLVTPHIAAGVNLAFWPAGGVLRRAGAFFIRRSFRGDRLYGTVLRRYVEYLIRSRFNVKFFIEGTRSRTGKMLAPAYGILKMVVEAYRHHAVEDIALVPVSICYDEVPEQGSYQKESAGGQKAKETASALIRTRKIVRKRFGKVYVRLGDPILAKEVVTSGPLAEEAARLELQKTAFQLCKSINDVTPITPKSIVASVLLAHRINALSLEEALRLADQMAELTSYLGATLSVERGTDFRRACEQILRRLQKSNVVSVTDTVPRTFFCENRKRAVLWFYKNNLLHAFSLPAIAILAFFNCLRQGRDRAAFGQSVMDQALALRNILKFEFFFSPSQTFRGEIEANLRFFFGSLESEGGFARAPASAWLDALTQRFSNPDDLSIYTRLVADFIESYATAGDFLIENKEGVADRRQLTPRILRYAEAKLQRGGVIFPESIALQNFQNALLFFENRRAITFRKEDEKTVVDWTGSREKLLAIREELQIYLDTAQETFAEDFKSTRPLAIVPDLAPPTLPA